MPGPGREEVRTPVERVPSRPAQRASPAVRPAAGPVEVAPAGRALLALQASAGNAAVGTLVAAAPVDAVEKSSRIVQRLAGPPASIPPPPVPPGPPVPNQHPGFKATETKLSAARRGLTAHVPAKAKADEAARAAKPPADDKEAQAKAAKAGEMGAAPTPGFDKAAFIAAVTAAIAKQMPKNLDEADKFGTSGKSEAAAAEVKGKVSQGKDDSAKPMTEASEKPPDTSKAKDKAVEPLPGAAPAPAPPAINAGAAMPAKAPAEQTNLGNGPAETSQQMAEAGITEEQLAKSNEPQFTDALAAKKAGEAHSAAAPAAFRDAEATKLSGAAQGAGGAGTQAVAAMTATRTTGLQQVRGAQQQGQSHDEQKRAEVSTRIKSIFDATKTEVDAILKGMDPLVDKAFTEGERKAKELFTTDLNTRMEKFKDERYSGPSGWAQWVVDQFKPVPPEVQEICDKARKLYETEMAKVISSVADLIGRELTRAKDRVAKGRQEITTYLGTLDPALKAVGQQAAKEIGSQFDSLTASIDEKSESLVDDLAERYVSARQAVDEDIKKMQEESKGLWQKAKDAVGGAVDTILKLKNMLLGVLARAAGAVEKIIADPIAFLGNFVNAVKTGVMNFGSHILEHLKKGLQSWLFGALAEAGIEIPATFDLKGIVGLILSLLGLTWASIRARLAKVLPEWVLTALETAVEVVKILTTEGVGGLWKWIVDKITDLKEQVMSQIREFVITKIITAGITWLISLLNPAAAFIKACKMIYDAVMWFVDNAERLGDFVNSVLDSVESIASGGVGKVAALIEATLGKAVPMVISGLASLLGLGGIAEKIKKILETIQKPVGKVVDSIITGVIKYGKKLLGKLKKKKKEESPEEKQKRLEKGVSSGVSAANKLVGKPLGQKMLKPILAAIKLRDRLGVLEPVKQGKVWAVHGEVQRMTTLTKLVAIDEAKLKKVNKERTDTSPVYAKAKKDLESAARKLAKGGDPAAKTVLTQQQILVKQHGDEFDALRKEHDPIQKSGQGDDARMDHMLARFPQLRAVFLQIIETLKSISATPEELEKAAEPLRKEIAGQLRKAAEDRLSEDVKKTIKSHPTLRKDYVEARLDLTRKFRQVPQPVTKLPELQTLQALKTKANELQALAKRMKDAAAAAETTTEEEIAELERSIKKIIGQTTLGERPGATVGEGEDKGTSEAAVQHEVKTGEMVGHRTHHKKCEDDARGLTNAIAELTALDAQLSAKPRSPKLDRVIEEIAELKKAATERRSGLQRGVDTWNNRGIINEKLWVKDGKLLDEPIGGWKDG